MARNSTTAATGSSNVSSIDSNHPYHLHPYDNPGMTLVNTLFDGTCFQGWKRSVLIGFSAKKKIGFIIGNHVIRIKFTRSATLA